MSCLASTKVGAQDESAAARARRLRVYFGTYTRGESLGIYTSTFDPKTGDVSGPRLAAETVNPSFLAIHPSQRFLYAVGEISDFDGRKSGGVSAFAIDPLEGKLNILNQSSSGGAGPCHLVVDATGKNVLVANYGGGSIACLPIAEDGRLGDATAFIQHQGSSVNPQRQQGPHAHSINLDPQNRHAVSADLGLDKVLVYRFDAQAHTLAPNDPPSVSVPPGCGPRHLAFHPSGKFAYVNEEITSQVTALGYDADRGEFQALQTISTLPEGVDDVGNSTAEVRVHPNGRFVYVSNRGHNSIARFGVDTSSGRLSPLGQTPTGGEIPRNFNLTPEGGYLLAANQDSDNVVVFRVNAADGSLDATGKEIEVPSPVCVRFVRPAAAQ